MLTQVLCLQPAQTALSVSLRSGWKEASVPQHLLSRMLFLPQNLSHHFSPISLRSFYIIMLFCCSLSLQTPSWFLFPYLSGEDMFFFEKPLSRDSQFILSFSSPKSCGFALYQIRSFPLSSLVKGYLCLLLSRFQSGKEKLQTVSL